MISTDTKAKIIVIDDEHGIRDLLTFELGSRGYEVKSAPNGEEGVESVRREKFDLAIMDIKMPKMDGVTALGKIKEVEPDIDVIMATGFGTVETAIESMKKGACDYIEKPFNIDEVAILIEKVLEKRKLKETVALYEVSKALFSTIRLEELLEIIINSTPRVLKADDAAFILCDAQGKPASMSSYGLHGPEEEGSRKALGERFFKAMAESGEKALIINDIGKDKRSEGIEGLEQVHSSIFLLLQSRQKVLGLLSVHRTKITENFYSVDIRKADLFVSLVTMAIDNANLYKELQTTQSQLIQSEKMAALGQMAGGAAHELNNPLTSILGNAQILLTEVPKDNPWRIDIITIEESAQRCKRIINNLLGFARQHEFVLQNASINDVLEKTLDLCQNQVELKKIGIVKEYGKELPPVHINPMEMQQVFLNIILNAQQAMPEGGSLTITTRQVSNMIEVIIKDNGLGIKKENINKIFEPFFTTKELGQGTGLGLSVSLGIVQKHKGEIRAESEGEGKGTAFTVSLPAAS